MTEATRRGSPGWLGALLGSAEFARAYTIAVLGTVFAAYLIEHLAGRVTYATIVTTLCATGVGVLISRRREISLLRLVPISLIVLVGWMLASVFWASDSGQSFWSWVYTAAIALLAVVIGHVRDTLQTARALGDVLRVLLSASLAVEVLSGILLDIPFRFIGVQGRIAEFGPIQGIFGTRNALGFVAVLALITFLVEHRTQSVRPGVSLLSVVLAGLLAVLSDSPTVLVLAATVGLAAAVLALVRHTSPARRSALQWTIGSVVVAGLVVVYSARAPLIRLLGAQDDLALRTELWSDLIGYVRFHPVQGWGWYGPWATDEFPFNSVNYWLHQNHASALNAYVDVLIQLGWVGLVLFVTFAAAALVRSWLDASERRSIVYAWTPLILVALLADSLFESFTLSGLGWLMLVVCAVRAGQSRSWRGRLRDGPGGEEPDVLEELPHER
ncbi:O-antigen ligase family protein [Microbacterium sp. BWT-B31]|uniref:O-antigen ligase family protein n=1 Tax=Microbacterium sp. BWT-B31 TaxID=3232072 RepID=UPI003526D04D